jgi:hypothetical protein
MEREQTFIIKQDLPGGSDFGDVSIIEKIQKNPIVVLLLIMAIVFLAVKYL